MTMIQFKITSNTIHLIFYLYRALEQKRLEELRLKIASGTEQIARGQVTDGEVVLARLQEKISLISESDE